MLRPLGANLNMKSIVRRIERLEVLAATTSESELPVGDRWWKWRAAFPPIQVRLGHLRCLPSDYHGERHIAVTERLPDRDGWEWVEYAEVPGPAPVAPPPAPRLPRYINVIFVAPSQSSSLA